LVGGTTVKFKNSFPLTTEMANLTDVINQSSHIFTLDKILFFTTIKSNVNNSSSNDGDLSDNLSDEENYDSY
jgi:hypothetical protein